MGFLELTVRKKDKLPWLRLIAIMVRLKCALERFIVAVRWLRGWVIVYRPSLRQAITSVRRCLRRVGWWVGWCHSECVVKARLVLASFNV